MRLTSLLPLLVLAFIGWHSKAALKSRIGGVLSLPGKITTKQHIGELIRVARLTTIGGDELPFHDGRGFRAFVKKSLRTGPYGGDVSLDAWGTPYEFKLDGRLLTVISAGPDKEMDTEDDLVESTNLYDF